MSNNPEICINIAFNESREFEGLWLDLSKPLIESYRDIKAIADIRQLTVKSYDIKGSLNFPEDIHLASLTLGKAHQIAKQLTA